MQTFFSSPLGISVVVLAVVNIALIVAVIWMHTRLKRFLVGFDSKNIGDSLNFVSNGLTDLETFRKEMESYLTQVEKRLRKSVQSVHTVRFNPYKGTGDGGNQSFATALLSENGNGVVISSLHSRDHTRVFSKPISNNQSSFELSEEEKEALDNAKNMLSS